MHHYCIVLGFKNILWGVASVETKVLHFHDEQMRVSCSHDNLLQCIAEVEVNCISLTEKSWRQNLHRNLHIFILPKALIRERSALSVIICSLASPCEGSQMKGIVEFLRRNRHILPSALTRSKEIRKPFNNTTIWQGFCFHFEGCVW